MQVRDEHERLDQIAMLGKAGALTGSGSESDEESLEDLQLVKDKLEVLCRELQKANKAVVADAKASAAAEAAKRSALSDKFESGLGDISEKLNAHALDREASLKENEERYRALVENAPEAIVVLDVDSNRFVDANDNACALFNLPRKRLLSIGPQAISPRMQPDGSPSFGIRRGYIERALQGEHPIFEWVHKNIQGEEFPCEVRFSRLPSEGRKLIRVSITDIAERSQRLLRGDAAEPDLGKYAVHGIRLRSGTHFRAT